jgi:peptide/nickel transport system ATP-binding protein
MTTIENGKPLLEIHNLKKYFPIEKGFFRRVVGHVRAVDDVSLDVQRGKTMGLVGESGSGKTTLAHCVLRAYDLTAGEILFRPGDREYRLGELDAKELRVVRPHMQMIFQDPYSSLDPRKTVYDIVSEPLRLNHVSQGAALDARVRELLEAVGLDYRHMKRYPHAFSGGQRQRIGVARALALNPALIVCDEPVSALDVSVQAQILNLLNDLQDQFNLTYLFIAHNLSVIEHICDDVAVMYVGKLMERAATEDLFGDPRHPYTEALLSAIPTPDPDHPLPEEGLEGELPDPANPPSGCYFHPRCNYAMPICQTEVPPWDEVEPGHLARCHFARELTLQGVH